MANERRTQEDLRKIVGVDGLESGLLAPEEKKSISGVRGIVYFDSSGNTQSTSGKPGLTTQPGGDESEGGTDGNQSGGGVPGGSNGGNTADDSEIEPPYPVDETAVEGDGVFSVDDLRLGDSVNALSGLTDCATGEPVDVRFDGNFTAPDGWDDANTPPIDDDYIPGSYWGLPTTNPAQYRAASPTGVASALSATFADRTYFVTGFLDGDFWLGAHFDSSPSVDKVQIIITYECLSSVDAYCTVLPQATQWPAEKPMQLSYNSETAQFETNPFDGNVSPEYKVPNSSFSLCNDAGDNIKLFLTADGGHAVYNTVTGIATFRDSSGKITGFGDGAAVTARQPR